MIANWIPLEKETPPMGRHYGAFMLDPSEPDNTCLIEVNEKGIFKRDSTGFRKIKTDTYFMFHWLKIEKQ